jgi:hypothetical protein
MYSFYRSLFAYLPACEFSTCNQYPWPQSCLQLHQWLYKTGNDPSSKIYSRYIKNTSKCIYHTHIHTYIHIYIHIYIYIYIYRQSNLSAYLPGFVPKSPHCDPKCSKLGIVQPSFVKSGFYRVDFTI